MGGTSNPTLSKSLSPLSTRSTVKSGSGLKAHGSGKTFESIFEDLLEP